MSEKRLSVDVARQFLEDPESVSLSSFESVDDVAAEVLSTCTFGLELDGLTSLSDAAAESLRHLGSQLWLGNIALLGKIRGW